MSGSLPNPPAEIIGRLLIDLAIGTDTDNADWRAFIESEPDEPDEVITVYDTANVLQGATQFGETQEHHGIQIRIRSGNYPLGWAVVNSLRTLLDTVNNDVVTLGANSYSVHGLHRTSGPFHLGTEQESEREIFTINYTTSLRLIP